MFMFILFVNINSLQLSFFDQECDGDQDHQILLCLTSPILQLTMWLGVTLFWMQNFSFSFVGPYDITFAHFFQYTEENVHAYLSKYM